MGDVAEPPPQAAALKPVEVEVLIEGGGPLVEGIDDYGASSELPASSHAAAERVDEQMTAEVPALL